MMARMDISEWNMNMIRGATKELIFGRSRKEGSHSR